MVEDRFRKEGQNEERWHLTLLARDDAGYRNLLKLGSLAFLEGYYYKPRMDYRILKEHAEGLICLSGCASGRLSRALQNGQFAAAEAEVERLVDIFGEDNVYLEMQETGIEELAEVNPRMAELAAQDRAQAGGHQRRPLPAREPMPRAHDVLLCIQTGSRLSEENRMRFSSEEFFFKSEEEMLDGVPRSSRGGRQHPGDRRALQRRDRARGDAHPALPGARGLRRGLLPARAVRAGPGAPLRRRGDAGGPGAARERAGRGGEDGLPALLPHRLGLRQLTPSGPGIPVGPGRGSAAGSLVSYLLGITDLDPIKYDLLFERFLNPDRISMPDIDIDFSVNGREKVIEYVANKYGRDRVAQIATFGTIKARQAIRDAARVMDVPYGQADRIAKLVPEVLNITLDACLADTKGDLRKAYDSEDLVREVIDMARPLEGLIRQDSIHAAGVVISKGPLTDHLPLMQKGDAEVVTQVSMTDVEKLGLLKMDFLGPAQPGRHRQRRRHHPRGRAPGLRHRDHPSRRRPHLPDAGQGRLGRGVPVRIQRHARGAARDPAHPARRPHRPGGPLPSGAHGVHPGSTRATSVTRPGSNTRTTAWSPSSAPLTGSPSTKSS